ncbi:MAG: RraA family protein [Rhodospirillales bacterium]
MALIIQDRPATLLSKSDLAPWRDVPTAIISDELNRTGTLQAAIKPLRRNVRVAAQALTIQCMVGDNAALHHGVPLAWPGCALVIDGRAHCDTALWGGVLNAAAEAKDVTAVIVDGAVRDVAELRDSIIVVYTRAVIPNGPHKGFGGGVNVPIQCAGVPVNPGDLIVGDDDGVVVIRPDQWDGLYERCRNRMDAEERFIAEIAAGKTTVDLLGIPAPEDYK